MTDNTLECGGVPVAPTSEGYAHHWAIGVHAGLAPLAHLLPSSDVVCVRDKFSGYLLAL